MVLSTICRGDIQVKDHPDLGWGDGKEQYALFLHFWQQNLPVSMVVANFGNDDIGFNRQNVSKNDFLASACAIIRACSWSVFSRVTLFSSA